jgi:predicted ATPase
MTPDRITQLRISGLRAIRDLTLSLRGLTVLIGDNGTGKSSIVEALEILRNASKPIQHVTDVIVRGHGGFRSLLRRGSDELRIGVTIEGNGPPVDYDFAVANVGISPAVVGEWVDVHANPAAREPLHVLIRRGASIQVFDAGQRKLVTVTGADEGAAGEQAPVSDQALALPQPGVWTSQAAVRRLIDALGQMEVHVPFETRPVWQQRELGVNQGPHWPALVESADRLTRYGVNLPNAFQQLRNSGGDVWKRVLQRAQLGLGEDLREFSLSPSGRGNIELEVLFGAFPDRPLPADVLSEGQISYLGFLALCALHPHRSVLVFDEPEAHLHPALLARVVMMLEEVAESAPVIVATHSDRLLDALRDPAASVALCELDESRAMQIRRPDAARLSEWLEDYRGLGSLRSEGYESHVFAAPAATLGRTAK